MAILSSIIIGACLVLFRILETKYLWIVLSAILVIYPIFVFLASDGNTEFQTAFYKTWRDIFKGKVDQHKIFKSFARKYEIQNYLIRPEEVEADGRWNFLADTNYMRTIVSQRNMLLDDLNKEYNDTLTSLDESIITLEKEYIDRQTDLKTVRNSKERTKTLSDKSKIAAEKYYYREQLEEKITEDLLAENEVHEAFRRLNIAKKNRDNLKEQYEIIKKQIYKIYNERYAKYTETAIKKLNRIHGLKYKIADISEIEKGV